MPAPENPSLPKGHTYFDPKPPAPPEQILGIPTQPIINLGEAATNLMVEAPYWSGKPLGLYSARRLTQNLLAIFPLLEKVQVGEEIQPDAVRLYRKPIKQVVPKLGVASGFTAVSSLLLVGIPLRKTLNRKIETEFCKRAPEAFEKVREKAEIYLPQAEQYVVFLSEFEDPKEQFISEVDFVAESIRQTAQDKASRRSRATEVTATDAAYGINDTLNKLTSPESGLQQRVPMLTHFVLEQMQSYASLPKSSQDILGVVAPEILTTLDSVLPPEMRDTAFIESVVRHPHPKRGLAETFKGRKLAVLQANLPTLMLSIRDLLPDNGEELRNQFERVKNFMKVSSK